MSDNIVDSMGNSELMTSLGLSTNSLHLSFSSDHVEEEVITISYDSGSERVVDTLFEGEISSFVSLDTL